MRTFGWSLVDIDETAIETLLPFIRRMTEDRGPKTDGQYKTVYADEVTWL